MQYKIGFESISLSHTHTHTHPKPLLTTLKTFTFHLVQGCVLLGKPTAQVNGKEGDLNQIPAATTSWNFFNYTFNKSMNTFQTTHLSPPSKENH